MSRLCAFSVSFCSLGSASQARIGVELDREVRALRTSRGLAHSRTDEYRRTVRHSNPELAAQFRLALDFWSKVLDLEWHEDNSRTCSLEIADGKRELFEPEIDTMAARSQFPDRRAFQGWIAFNPAITLSKTELYRISVHEIGHVLGLHHNLDVRSLMYSLDLDCSDSLDART